MCFHAGFKTDESTRQNGNYLIVKWLVERSVRPVQIKVCIYSAVPSGYRSGGGGPIHVVAEGCSVSGQAVAGPYKLSPTLMQLLLRRRQARAGCRRGLCCDLAIHAVQSGRTAWPAHRVSHAVSSVRSSTWYINSPVRVLLRW